MKYWYKNVFQNAQSRKRLSVYSTKDSERNLEMIFFKHVTNIKKVAEREKHFETNFSSPYLNCGFLWEVRTFKEMNAKYPIQRASNTRDSPLAQVHSTVVCA